MKENQDSYLIYPLVVKANNKSKISVFSKMSSDGRESLVNPWNKIKIGGKFTNKKQYEIKVEPREIQNPVNLEIKEIEYKIVNEYIVFDYDFKEEQEYIIFIYENYNDEMLLLTLFKIYALNEDLYKLTPLKGEMHMHSNFSDGKQPPEIMYGNARMQGMEFALLTDHYQLQPTKSIKNILKNIDIGMKIYNGEEVHKLGQKMHIVSFGANQCISEKLENDFEKYKAQALKIADAHEQLPNDISKLEYGLQRVVYEQIHKANGLAILAHPYWSHEKNKTNIPTSLSRLTIKEQYVDAWEIVGVDDGDKDFMQNVLYMEEIRKGNNMPVVGATDAHTKENLGDGYSIIFATKNNEQAIKKAIKSNLCVGARQYKRADNKMRYMAFGPTRLVRYAMFLMNEFYSVQNNLCEIEGKLIIEYVSGQMWAKDLIKKVAKQIESEKQLCFGKKSVNSKKRTI